MKDEVLLRFVIELKRTAEFNRMHESISVDRYAAVMDVANALETALEQQSDA